MSSNNIQIKATAPKHTQKDLFLIFEDLLLEQEKKLRNKAVQFWIQARKKRTSKFITAQQKGYINGYTKGSKDSQRAFSNTTKLVRAFRKHLEQASVSFAIEVLNAIIPDNKTVNNHVIKNLIHKLSPKLRQMTLIKIYVNPCSNILSQIQKEPIFCNIPVETDDSVSQNQLKLVSPNGELTLCARVALKHHLEEAIKKLCAAT